MAADAKKGGWDEERAAILNKTARSEIAIIPKTTRITVHHHRHHHRHLMAPTYQHYNCLCVISTNMIDQCSVHHTHHVEMFVNSTKQFFALMPFLQIVGIVCAYREMLPKSPPQMVRAASTFSGMQPKAPPPALNPDNQLGEYHLTAVAGPWWPQYRPRHVSKPKPPPPLLPPHQRGSWLEDPCWISAPIPDQVEMAKLVGEQSVQLVAWYAEMPPSIVCLGWSCSKGNDVSKHVQRWFEHSLTA